jgi:hypothetical protein
MFNSKVRGETLSRILSKYNAINVYEELKVLLHEFLNLNIIGEDKWSASRPDRFIPSERCPRTHWIGGYKTVFDPLTKNGN